ncbi:uncharacterized protein LOC113203301 [Frankliniella occidentalis]|uniref:Uncharacterized protein LOC113203301 n=1 Tax=Frankliniella occidentalis TaxID=133901 RepID=A0A6J1RY39_FRAOC|nr:uncharacterized protein LOC113203301 [Frankliniella occidentalis]
MPRQVLLLLACTAAACQCAPREEDESAQRMHAAEPQAQASGSERLNLVSASGWRPIHDVLAAGSSAASGEHRLPRTPSYAAPLSAAELARPKDLQRTSKRDLSVERKEQDRQRVDVVLPVGVGAPGARATRDPLPPRTAPWDRPRVAPISEPDNDVESVYGYRYPPPILGGPGLQAVAAGPSPTAPFWEAAWLRRRERLLQELGLPSLLPPPPCRCAPVDPCLGYLPDGNPGRYRLETDPYRLGVGPYGLYGAWGRPLHSHNSAPLGAAQLHDNPN